jgi:hypothetical protein
MPRWFSCSLLAETACPGCSVLKDWKFRCAESSPRIRTTYFDDSVATMLGLSP